MLIQTIISYLLTDFVSTITTIKPSSTYSAARSGSTYSAARGGPTYSAARGGSDSSMQLFSNYPNIVFRAMKNAQIVSSVFTGLRPRQN